MEQKEIKNINDINREYLEDFISKMTPEEKTKMKNYMAEHPQRNASGVFTAARSYVYNTYFRTTPPLERRKSTFAETLDSLLE